ncbi:TetR/AcrR family transcriptional regulator [Streptoalloteichus hindustanus]|uniref:Transcriptional regulator, TetR family n=1 Tax=Streptoalloteichus hindustanus TaxID=2017 RepID=A0A1M5FBH5_STRHI|nr:TetR/AcrR family transcriptional regulator [Streptoalloteichus hindustanus]SHF88915.1 transcriptional regulator, TetR family [Streptoalloteichus hindustanus]
MGNREDLLDGAKRCLREKGYGRTTARDITAVAGTSLASIGYHFGSTKALLDAALFEAVGEWTDELRRALDADVDPQAGPLARFEAYWTRMIESFVGNRELWAATMEVFGQIDRIPGMRQAIAEGLQEGRVAWAAMIQGIDADVDAERAQAVGSLHQALLSGVMVQWLVDPERAPSARDLTEALRMMAAGIEAEASGGTA